MATYTALTTLTGRQGADALGEAMERMDPAPIGVGVFEVEDGSGLWEVGGYFDNPPDGAALALLAAAFGAAAYVVSELPDVDWVAKVRRELSPVEAGRFFVFGSHDIDKVPQDRIGLLIEASMAFGTGHHGTTLGCLNALDRLIQDGLHPTRILDLGCGTAVLAMAAAKVWPDTTPIASDIDQVAIEVAAANVTANDLHGRIHCVEADGLKHSDLEGPFDLLFANILKAPLLALAPDIARALAPSGTLILSGLLTEQGRDIIAAYAAQRLTLKHNDRVGDWLTLTFAYPT